MSGKPSKKSIPQSPHTSTPESTAKTERFKKLSPIELGDRVKKLWERRATDR